MPKPSLTCVLGIVSVRAFQLKKKIYCIPIQIRWGGIHSLNLELCKKCKFQKKYEGGGEILKSGFLKITITEFFGGREVKVIWRNPDLTGFS